MIWNQAYEQFADGVAFWVGMPMADVVNQVVSASGSVMLVDGRAVTVAERMAMPRGSFAALERRTADGRILLVRERRTADGGTVITSADVTDLKIKEETLEGQVLALRAARADAERHAEHLARMTDMLTR